MKLNEYKAWVEKDGKVKRMLGSYYCLNKKEAKILAQADAIRGALDYNLVKVCEITNDND